MKNLLGLIIVLSVCSITNAQVFHFDTHSTTLVKTTEQSPAHWYIEIFSDITMDTTLRWKAFFSTIPSAWQISLDDQTNYTNNIQDGDSSDFTLFAGLAFPQKLIIGASLNNEPGTGSVFLKIYDPEFPSYSDTIEFRFIVSAVGIVELVNEGIIKIENNVLTLANENPASLKVYDSSGRLIVDDSTFKRFDCSTLPSNQLFYVTIQQGGKYYTIKWIR